MFLLWILYVFISKNKKDVQIILWKAMNWEIFYEDRDNYTKWIF